MGATLLLSFLLLYPALFIFHPAPLTFFFAILAQMHKFQVQTMGPFYHCSLVGMHSSVPQHSPTPQF